MNDFTRTELSELRRCLTYMIKGGITPYSCATIALNKKVRKMYEGYCDHEWRKGVHLFNDVYCTKCNKSFAVANNE